MQSWQRRQFIFLNCKFKRMSFFDFSCLAIVASAGAPARNPSIVGPPRGAAGRARARSSVCASRRPRPHPIQKGAGCTAAQRALPCMTLALRPNHLAALDHSPMCMPGMLTFGPCLGSSIWPERRVGSRGPTEIRLNSRTAGRAPASFCYMDGYSFEGCANRGDVCAIGGSCDMPCPTWTSA